MHQTDTSTSPLPSGDQAKVLIFVLISFASIIFILGILPAIFLGFGVWMMRKSKDFSHLETAGKIAKWYAALLAVIFLSASCYEADRYFEVKAAYDQGYGWSPSADEAWGFFGAASGAVSYVLLLEFLFIAPLRARRCWVCENGIFATIPSRDTKSKVDILKAEGVRSYSVADELIKWSKLKDDRVVSQAEFEKARKKLLGSE